MCVCVCVCLRSYHVGMPLTTACDQDVEARCNVDKKVTPFLQSGYILVSVCVCACVCLSVCVAVYDSCASVCWWVLLWCLTCVCVCVCVLQSCLSKYYNQIDKSCWTLISMFDEG